MPQRLNKYLAANFGLSRREADDLIADGKVSVNGKIASLGERYNDGDAVMVGKKAVKSLEHFTYLLFYKPSGYVCSRKRQDGAATIYDILPKEYRKLKTVGRLDKDSSGLILLSNDGDFAFRHTHPKFFKLKVYHVGLDHPLEPLHQQMIGDFGIDLKDGKSKLALTRIDDARLNWQVEMSEGRNRQVRRTFGALGYTVEKLERLKFGEYSLGDLKPGEWKKISVHE